MSLVQGWCSYRNTIETSGFPYRQGKRESHADMHDLHVFLLQLEVAQGSVLQVGRSVAKKRALVLSHRCDGIACDYTVNEKVLKIFAVVPTEHATLRCAKAQCSAVGEYTLVDYVKHVVPQLGFQLLREAEGVVGNAVQ